MFMGEADGRGGEIGEPRFKLFAAISSSVLPARIGDLLGLVSASKEATLKLLILELDFCCGGTVGLVIAVRNGVTVIPDDFIINRLFHNAQNPVLL